MYVTSLCLSMPSYNVAVVYQLYTLADRALTKTLIKEAVAGGVVALCYTVDSPVTGNREISPSVRFLHCRVYWLTGKQNAAKSLVMSSRDGASPFIDADSTWKDIKFIKKYCGATKLIVKGILCVEDAIRARDEGADGVILSNHGVSKVVSPHTLIDKRT
jgi:isopentenyl diphosphate isomerase/L-lactate dehydrogenase-like FMN-dependent dehydrogenase